MSETITLEPKRREIQVNVEMLRDENYFYVACPSLDLIAYGDNLDEAKEAFGEMLRMFIDDLVERGTLHDVLEELGWICENDEWAPPPIIARETTVIAFPACYA